MKHRPSSQKYDAIPSTGKEYQFQHGLMDIVLETSARTASNVVAYQVSKHDAPLLVASPDMLAALEGIVSHNNSLTQQYKLSRSLMGQIERAIDKATP